MTDRHQTVTVSDLIAELEQHDGDLSVALEVGSTVYSVEAIWVYGDDCLTLVAGDGVSIDGERGLPS